MAGSGGQDDSWEYSLRKYLLLLASLVATVTYGAGFNPPGGVWQAADRDKGRIAGDPIIRETNHARYLAFFYGNATAFASSLVVIVLILILSILHDRGGIRRLAPVLAILRSVMVLDLLSLMGAYAAGTFRDVLTAVYSLVLLAGVVAYLVVHLAPDKGRDAGEPPAAPQEEEEEEEEEDADSAEGQRPARGSPAEGTAADKSALLRLRKVLLLLATFAASVTFAAGLSAPGGFWDHAEDDHRPGDAVLKGGPHDARLKAFFVCNTTAFVASLLILVMLLEKRLYFSEKVRSRELYGLIAVVLLGLVAAYAAGSSREVDTTVYVTSLVGAVVVCVLVQVVFVCLFSGNGNGNGSDGQQQQTQVPDNGNGSEQQQQQQTHGPNNCNGSDEQQQQHHHQQQPPQTLNGNGSDQHEVEDQQTTKLERARSLVLLLATLAAAITYQAGLNPPGGLWQNNDRGGRYMAGDPILLTESPRRFKAFYYCNSIAFVASLVAIILARMKTLHHHNALEAAMVLDLFGLIGAYAAGSCRDVSTSVYAVALAGAVLVYVVIHVVFLTLDHEAAGVRGGASPEKERKAEELLEKRRKRLLLFAILAATITYQAGLTPPGGFLVNDDGGRAGDPVLLNNYPRRFKAFYYCNSVSFMLSIALIILLVNPNLYRPAIRSNALSVCTAAGLMGIMGGYAAGCTQHLKTSIYIFVLAALVLSFVVVLVAVFFVKHLRTTQEDRHNGASNSSSSRAAAENNAMGEEQPPPAAPVVVAEAGRVRRKKKVLHAKRKYLMLLGILAASVTYQAGLAPPGGSWQSNDGEHTAGDPVMHDNRRPRYRAFFYSNSTSFVASVVVIVLLLPPSLHEQPWWLGVMNATIVLDLAGLLVAYAAGSGRTWKTSVKVSALVVAVLAYFAIHVLLSRCSRRGNNKKTAPAASAADPNEEANGGLQAQLELSATECVE
ncbi:uncharacterized protein LOC120699263 isoform X1 [Panicum virgatum]|uniref:PGG domain-containing protein n=1 Tax=Panicum virgatum TaxID=38727 RepID=A0A8T0V7F8_PANVG|nr:uncharacterized protein LOC120699263 isoform X1 [Panicum virgatum]KAG2628793.1 hypothetical protein PVAP13_3KG413900 [Panicum virgatum]